MSLFRRTRAEEPEPVPAPAPPLATLVAEPEPAPEAEIVVEAPPVRGRWQPRVVTDLEPLPAFRPGTGGPVD